MFPRWRLHGKFYGALRVTNFEKKKMITLTKKTSGIIWKDKKAEYKTFEHRYTHDKNYYKVNHFHYTGKYRGAAYTICNLKYSIPKEIAVVFHNISNYDCNFIIKDPAKQL